MGQHIDPTQSESTVKMQRYRQDPMPARDHYTAELEVTGPYTLDMCRRLLDCFNAAGVPPDATIQWSYPRVYAHWSREV